MRLVLDTLSSRGLRIELPSQHDEPHVIALSDLSALAGVAERRPQRFVMRPVTADQVHLTELLLRVGSGTVAIAAPAAVTTVDADLEVGLMPSVPPLVGEARVAQLNARQVRCEFPTVKVSGDLVVDGLGFRHKAKPGEVSGVKATARSLQLAIGAVLLRAEKVVASGLRVGWGTGRGVAVEAEAGEIGDLLLHSENLEISFGTVRLPEGVRYGDQALAIPKMVIDSIGVTVHDVLGRGEQAPDEDEAPAAAPQMPEEPEAKPKRPGFDMTMLDRLDGRLDVDLTLDLTVPVLGRRRATHHFRIPIQDGTLNYRELERDLSTLEDAIIDIELRGETLIVERDVPLLPRKGKPLVLWDLDEEGVRLAQKRLVRLRTLPRYRLDPSLTEKKPEGSKPSVALRRLDADNVELALSLAAPPDEIRYRGVVPYASVDSFTARGDIRHHANETLDATALSLGAGRIRAALDGLAVGGARIDVASLAIESIGEATLSFDGPRPRTLVATLGGVELDGVTVAFGASDTDED